MKTNLEKAKALINRAEITGKIKHDIYTNADYCFKDDALEAVELAATPNFYYYKDSDFPEFEKQVIFYCNKNKPYIGKLFVNNKFCDSNGSFRIWVKWCEIPY